VYLPGRFSHVLLVLVMLVLCLLPFVAVVVDLRGLVIVWWLNSSLRFRLQVDGRGTRIVSGSTGPVYGRSIVVDSWVASGAMDVPDSGSKTAPSELSASVHPVKGAGVSASEAMSGPPEPYPSPYVQSEDVSRAYMPFTASQLPQISACSHFHIDVPFSDSSSPVACTPALPQPVDDMEDVLADQVDGSALSRQALADVWSANSAVVSPADPAYPTFQSTQSAVASNQSTSQAFSPPGLASGPALSSTGDAGMDSGSGSPRSYVAPVCAPFSCYSRMYDVIPGAPPDVISLPDGSLLDLGWQDPIYSPPSHAVPSIAVP
jgi:hypothetical protein